MCTIKKCPIRGDKEIYPSVRTQKRGSGIYGIGDARTVSRKKETLMWPYLFKNFKIIIKRYL